MKKQGFWRKLFLIFLISATLFSVTGSWIFSLQPDPTQPLPEEPMSLFWRPLKILFPLSLLGFSALYFFVFLYFRAFVGAGSFLIQLFGKPYAHQERRRALFYLSHTKNPFLKKIRPALHTFLTAKPEKEGKTANTQTDLSFQDIIHKAERESQSTYPDLKLQTELKADIPLPFCANMMFQALWELLKNAQQVNPAQEPVTIRTYEKGTGWFCCEVEDKGPGMNRALMEKASKLYWTTKEEATGLGLPFVQSALSRVGGLIQLKSPKAGGLKVLMFIPKDYLFHVQNFREQSTVPYDRQENPSQDINP